jgi:hypothetical protein
MQKTIALALNNYPVVPHSLRESPRANLACKEIKVGLAELYHHYYLDSYGRIPPNPNPTQFEHIQFLLPCPDFRFQGAGLGVAPAIRRHRSNELGQAFCRWFLHDHLNITYFAHIEHIINRQLHRAFDGFRIERHRNGDTPDYFCAESVSRVYLAEAKGRYTSISFRTREFQTWRDQFSRVAFLDRSGAPRSIKGHIVATRFVTERDSARLRSGVWAEDPASPGDTSIDEEISVELGASIIAQHYSDISVKMNQPLLATALLTGVPLPEELRVVAVSWRVVTGPLEGTQFVGGFFSETGNAPIVENGENGVTLRSPNIFRLDEPSPTFFGLERSVFSSVVSSARTSRMLSDRLAKFENTRPFYSGFSVLRDGTALGPLEFFAPVEVLTL